MRSMLTRMPMNPDVSVLLAGLYRVGLAKILDLYYEDLYTLPNKQSSSGLVSEISKLSKKELFIIANAIYYICWWMFSGSHWYSCSTLDDDLEELEKSNVLLMGPTGSVMASAL
ncbi:uncharacterized protein LOC131227262 isoform X3 [Magnolia sinica]|uniref:uncharacterized protein LOC131227262 isoform X3 n=1 Tax=Magnolia sinica TaxID=86752 RepID=UPI00265AC1E1|nr:uncharacterized protein LOC131227262 isoform X3 [Magnolia sinica]